MKKKIPYIIFLIFIILLVFLISKNFTKSGNNSKNINTPTTNQQENIQTDTKKNKEKEINLKYKTIDESYEFTSNFNVLAFGNDIIIYDGKKLIKKNDKFKKIFEIRLDASDFKIKTENEKIYILDKNQKILYKINKNGEVESQIKISENVQNIFPLQNNDIVVSYNTSVGTDGILVYDNDMKQKANINYPNALISTATFEEASNSIYVSTQVTNSAPKIINTIYKYNTKYDAQSVNNYENLVTISMISTSNNKFILDPMKLYILGPKYENIATIDASDSFAYMNIIGDKIYLLDGSKDVKILDKTGKLIEEKAFKEHIKSILNNSNTVVYVGNSSIHYQQEKLELAKDIKKSVLLKNNKLILFFKGNVEIIEIPY